MNEPIICTLDIESSPHLSWHFDNWKINIRPIQTVEFSHTISVAAKFLHEKNVRYVSVNESSESHVLEVAREWIDQADVLVTYNGDAYDIPRLQWGWDLWDIQRPSPFVSVDLFKLVKREYKGAPSSKSLAHIVDRLNLTGKLKLDNYFELWLQMNSEDPVIRARAWRRFKRYNKRDVTITEELFILKRPQITTIPNVALWGDGETVEDGRPTCPGCSSLDVQRQGFKRTRTRRYQQYQCQACGRWFSDTKSDRGVSST